MDNFAERNLTPIFEPAPEGGYTCFIQELPEVFSQAESLEQARANLWDAFELVSEYRRENPTPPLL